MIKNHQKKIATERFKSSKTVAVIITHEAFVVNKVLLANRLDKTLTGQNIILISYIGRVRLFEILNSRRLELNCEIVFLDKGKSRTVTTLEKIKNKISSLPYLKIYLVPAVLAEILDSKRIIKQFRKLLKNLNINSVIISESSPDYLAPEITKASKDIAIIYSHPYERMGPDDYALIYKNSNLQINDSLGRIIAKIFPKWKHHFQLVDILRASPEKILAQEILNISSEKPWETFGYLEDFILSSNNQINSYLIDICKVPDEKIIVTGSAQLDILYQLMSSNDKKEKMASRLHSLFGNDKPFILSALPQTHWVTGRDQAEFDNHKDMLEEWITPLTLQNRFNVLLSLHPSMKYSDFVYLEKDNAKIVDENIIDLMLFSELFVNCLSTVMQYAVACGIPVLNYDVYRYSDDLEMYKYNEFKGIVTVTSSNEYQRIIDKICSDTTILSEMRTEQKKVADDWGIIDGKSVERIISAIKNINNE